jgi:hypothetical protein
MRVRLWNDAYRHAIHAWEQFTTKRRGELTDLDFVKALLSNEVAVFALFDWPEGVIPGDRKVGIGGVRPGPKTFA